MGSFGQVVVGPPGSGKTTYCAGMLQYFKALGRDAVVFNMDPANENMPYEPAANIADLVSADAVAAELSLGPNGTLLYAMEYLEQNLDWLDARLKENRGKYILFDFPGQVELYTHNQCVRNIVQRLVKKRYRITAVNLVDSHYCTDPSKYIAVMLMSLTLMLQLELPAINVLSKIDLIEQFGELPMNLNLEFFTDNGNLRHLVEALSADPIMQKYARLNDALVEIIEDYSFVGYHTLNIQDKESVMRLTQAVDKSNGYTYVNMDTNKVTYDAIVGKQEKDSRWTLDVQERYIKK